VPLTPSYLQEGRHGVPLTPCYSFAAGHAAHSIHEPMFEAATLHLPSCLRWPYRYKMLTSFNDGTLGRFHRGGRPQNTLVLPLSVKRKFYTLRDWLGQSVDGVLPSPVVLCNTLTRWRWLAAHAGLRQPPRGAAMGHSPPMLHSHTKGLCLPGNPVQGRVHWIRERGGVGGGQGEVETRLCANLAQDVGCLLRRERQALSSQSTFGDVWFEHLRYFCLKRWQQETPCPVSPGSTRECGGHRISHGASAGKKKRKRADVTRCCRFTIASWSKTFSK